MAGLSNIRFAKTVPVNPPANCAAIYAMAFLASIRFLNSSPRVTTGLKCAPLIGLSKVMIMASIETIEIAFIVNWSPTSSVRLVAIIPEPITAVSKSAVPRNSANIFCSFIEVNIVGRYGSTVI